MIKGNDNLKILLRKWKNLDIGALLLNRLTLKL